jgi:hypothetical protein
MNPAGPLFDVNNPAERLDATDAEYVEVIHTEMNTFGIGSPIGVIEIRLDRRISLSLDFRSRELLRQLGKQPTVSSLEVWCRVLKSILNFHSGCNCK